jgi:hypothetical protein
VDDLRICRVIFNLGAKALDVNIQSFGIAEVIAAPDAIYQLVSG